MIKLAKAIATCGIGYMGKGGGSVAAAAYCVVWLLITGNTTTVWSIVLALAILLLGVWSSNNVESTWGHDSSKVVVDEVAGMMITLAWAPVELIFALIGFVLFRFFDILKPLGIRKAEDLPGGWGVMADDVLAGIYAFIVLQVVIYLADGKLSGLI
ncbi:phosphatidylglycerophosphatase A [Terrimonas sp. NA20]|uniref:Phosphatidylglycerophosphatase A n=1 Tax=Terrimonas ginsenosidimutans TaxID=2908004 RepID=A0ABS9KMU7_9BACT|nr:phosphatidylglycerophosphatase A [Terrimonas ginsenosidimutans]MCG2613651.1 phosphatidylglycerophosphatase A [Terrimonas ginsenosidimutans]